MDHRVVGSRSGSGCLAAARLSWEAERRRADRAPLGITRDLLRRYFQSVSQRASPHIRRSQTMWSPAQVGDAQRSGGAFVAIGNGRRVSLRESRQATRGPRLVATEAMSSAKQEGGMNEAQRGSSREGCDEKGHGGGVSILKEAISKVRTIGD